MSPFCNFPKLVYNTNNSRAKSQAKEAKLNTKPSSERYMAEVERIVTIDDPNYKPQRGGSDQYSVLLGIIVHPQTRVSPIIINYPGFNGDMSGYNNKYDQIAEMLHGKGFAVVQMGNTIHRGLLYEKSVIEDLRAVIEYAVRNSNSICNNYSPDIYLIGFSAGASAVAAVCADFPQVKKILLVAPSGDADENTTRKSLANFEGEVYITVGENDYVVGQGGAIHFHTLLFKAPVRELTIIPNCDHQFRGRINGQIMSKAPLWAFAGDTTFPSPKGGIVLYE